MMHFQTLNGRRYAQFARWRETPGLVHAFCLRPLDVSPRRDERAAQRTANRHGMATDLGLDPDRLCYCVQVHDTRIERVSADDAAGSREVHDGLATNVPGISLMTFSADCPLVLIHDPQRRALGLAHASWRCTVAGIVPRLVAALHDWYGCEPAGLQVGIGPGAGPCCYEVQNDVYEAAARLPQRDGLFERRDGRLYFDLWQANFDQLEAAGVSRANIDVAGICTMCRTDLFFSFRREGPGCGHFGLMAALTEAR